MDSVINTAAVSPFLTLQRRTAASGVVVAGLPVSLTSSTC